MIVTLIVCTARNGVIGRGGAMPWRMPSDLKHLKARTLGKPVVMGRRTFDSIGRPLPGRMNIVISRRAGFTLAGATVVPDLETAITTARAEADRAGAGEIMILGGGEIYRLALPLAGRVVRTELQADIDGDATFPPLDPGHWKIVSDTPLATTPSDDHPARILVYERQ